jgi:hypothetical protein
MYQDQVEQYKK